MNKIMSQWVMSSSLAMTLTLGMALNTSPYGSNAQLAANTEKSQPSGKSVSVKAGSGRQQNEQQHIQEPKTNT
ncbi:hypothetical protein M3231_24360 [Neobacillus mesonae]|nr:hypothetical protein [Neobacillus mesonae]